MRKLWHKALLFVITLIFAVACAQAPQQPVSPIATVPTLSPQPSVTALPKGAVASPEVITNSDQKRQAMAPKPKSDVVHHVKGGIEFSVNSSPMEEVGKTSFQVSRITEQNTQQILLLIEKYINQTQVVTLKGHALDVWEYCGLTKDNVENLVVIVPDSLWQKGSRATLNSLEGATLNFCPAADKTP